MKTIQTTVYSPAELKEANPDAFDKALQRWQQDTTDIPWTDETMESLKGLFDACSGVSLRDWSIGAYTYSSIKIDMDDEAEELTGKRAQNWIKANLLDGATWRRVTYDKRKGGSGWYYKITKRDGTPYLCEFTGYYADDEFVFALLENIRTGDNLREAFSDLARVASDLLEQDYEQAISEEEFLMQDHLQYTEDGRMFRG